MSHTRIEITSGGRTYLLDLASRELFREKEERVRLTNQQWELLRYLVENHQRLISKDKLQEKIWKRSAIGDETISQAIRSLRSALDDHLSRSLIVTEHGRGYRLMGDVKAIACEPMPILHNGADAARAQQSSITERHFRDTAEPGRIFIGGGGRHINET